MNCNLNPEACEVTGGAGTTEGSPFPGTWYSEFEDGYVMGMTFNEDGTGRVVYIEHGYPVEYFDFTYSYNEENVTIDTNGQSDQMPYTYNEGAQTLDLALPGNGTATFTHDAPEMLTPVTSSNAAEYAGEYILAECEQSSPEPKLKAVSKDPTLPSGCLGNTQVTYIRLTADGTIARATGRYVVMIDEDKLQKRSVDGILAADSDGNLLLPNGKILTPIAETDYVKFTAVDYETKVSRLVLAKRGDELYPEDFDADIFVTSTGTDVPAPEYAEAGMTLYYSYTGEMAQ